MKHFLRLCAFMFAVGMTTMVAIAQSFTWESLAPANAIQAVRNFEGNPNLAVTVQDVYQMTPRAADEYVSSQVYDMTTDRYSYVVSQYSHYWFFRTDRLFRDKATFYGQPYDDVALTQKMMTQAAAQAIAQQFVGAHCTGSALLKLTNTIPRYGMTTDGTSTSTTFIESYLFNFDRTILPRPGTGYPTKAPTYCNIRVDTVNGDVIEYYQCWFPATITSYLPKLNGTQVMANAMNAAVPGTGVPGTYDRLYVTYPDAMGVETLAEDVSFGTTTDSMAGYTASVDLFTGAVIYIGVLQGGVKPNKSIHIFAQEQSRAIEMKKRLAIGKPLGYKMGGHVAKLTYPPLLIANRPYLYAGYLTYGAPGAKLVAQGQQSFAIAGKERQTSFRLTSQEYTLNGKKRRMAGNPVVINGAWYVPLDAARAVLGSSLTYDAKGKAVCFDPPAARIAKAPVAGH